MPVPKDLYIIHVDFTGYIEDTDFNIQNILMDALWLTTTSRIYHSG